MKPALPILMILLLGLTPGLMRADGGDTNRIRFSPEPGFWFSDIDVKMEAGKKAKIIYTLDGTIPVPGISPEFAKPLHVTTNTVIRAAVVEEGKPLHTETASYFIREKVTLPVVSISVPPDSFFGKEHGVYTLYYHDFETAGNFEFFEIGKGRVWNSGCGLRVSGSATRSLEKKSLRIVSKDKYGPGKFSYAFFPDKPWIGKFKGLMLRADASTGPGKPYHRSGDRVRNEMVYWMNREMGSNVDMQAYRPVVVYINGKYWGLYNLMERKDVDFIRSNRHEKDIDLLDAEDLYEEAGDKKAYRELLAYMNDHDLNDTAVWRKMEGMIDMDNFIDYWVINSYIAAYDFEVNIRFWRPRRENGKWRWISYDNDSWGDPDHEYFTEQVEEEKARSIFVLGRMMSSRAFRTAFLNRLSDCMNTVFLPDNMRCWMSEIHEQVRREVNRDRFRWEGLIRYMIPGTDMEELGLFADERPEYLREEVVHDFELDGTAVVKLEVQPPGSGCIRLNTIYPDSYPWNGTYFAGIPVTVSAVPGAGFTFDHWEGSFSGSQPMLTKDPEGGLTARAVFRKKAQ